jgi:hypothetical protein
MSNVTQLKGHQVRKKLELLVPKLVEGQEKLEEGYNLMYSLEEKVSAIDEEVQRLLQEYGKEVGFMNIENEFLIHASGIMVNLESGEVGLLEIDLDD